MAPSRKASAKSEASRVRCPTAKMRNTSAGLGLVGSALPPPTRSSSPSAGRGSEGRDLGGRLGKVVQELAATPVEEGSHIGSTLNEALHDQEFVERAARWRGGNYGRQVASVLAKVAKCLKMIRPEILEDASSPSGLQPVRPLPLVPVGADAGLSSRLRQKWQTWYSSRRISFSWTFWMCLAFMLLLYPRLVAAVLVLIIRLFIRAFTLVVGRLLMELWAETRSLLWTAIHSSWTMEDTLVEWLDYNWGLSGRPPAPTPIMTSQNTDSQSVPVTPMEGSSPAPPALLPGTCALTFLLYYLRRPPTGAGGLGR